jgi:hypothetical protein
MHAGLNVKVRNKYHIDSVGAQKRAILLEIQAQ